MDVHGPTHGVIPRLLWGHLQVPESCVLLMEDVDSNAVGLLVTDGTYSMVLGADQCGRKFVIRVGDEDYVLGRGQGMLTFHRHGDDDDEEEEKKRKEDYLPSLRLCKGQLLYLHNSSLAVSDRKLIWLSRIESTTYWPEKEPVLVSMQREVAVPDLPLPAGWKLQGGVVRSWWTRELPETWPGCGYYWRSASNRPAEFTCLQLIGKEELGDGDWEILLSDGLHYRSCDIKERAPCTGLSTVPLYAIIYSNATAKLPGFFWSSAAEVIFRILSTPDHILGEPHEVGHVVEKNKGDADAVDGGDDNDKENTVMDEGKVWINGRGETVYSFTDADPGRWLTVPATIARQLLDSNKWKRFFFLLFFAQFVELSFSPFSSSFKDSRTHTVMRGEPHVIWWVF